MLSTQETLQEQVIKRNVELTKVKASGIPATDSLLLEAQALFETRTNLFADTSNDVAHGAEVKAAFADIIYCQAPRRGLWNVVRSVLGWIMDLDVIDHPHWWQIVLECTLEKYDHFKQLFDRWVLARRIS